MQGKGSKAKGRQGEKDWATLCTSEGFPAYRDGKQFFRPDGTRIHQDVQHDVDGIHFEVKRREKIDVPSWMAQAALEAGARIPVVAWRGNRQPWRVIMNATDYFYLIRKIRDMEEALSEDSSLRE
jgi:hypothetical protein